jgi:hypothetical protein
VDSTKAKWVNLLKRAEKWMLLAKKMKAAENNLQRIDCQLAVYSFI